MGEFVSGQAGDTEYEGFGGTSGKVGLDGVDALAGEAEGVDEGMLPGTAEESGTGVAVAGIEGNGAADDVAEAEAHEGVEVGAVFVAAGGYAEGVGDGDAGRWLC